MTFHVGMKVVCVKRGDWSDCYGWEKTPIFGEVYTVRHFDEHGLLLFEIVNPKCWHSEGVTEPQWCETRFRPLTDRKTDTSIFTSMLTPNKQGVEA